MNGIYSYPGSFRYYLYPLIAIFLATLSYIYVTRQTGFTQIFGVTVFGLGTINACYICYEIWHNAPKTLRIDGGKLFVKMFFGKEGVIDISAIERIVDSRRRQGLSSFPIVIYIQASGKFVIGRNLKNLENLINTIKHLNPNCIIEGKLLERILRKD